MNTFKHVICAAIFFACALTQSSAQKADLNALFKERSRSLVRVSYNIQKEEDRQQIYTLGIVANADGIIILPSNAVGGNLPINMLKDFKVYGVYGNPDGYKCVYLGTDNIYGMNYLKFEGPLPECFTPISAFKTADFKIADSVWGMGQLNDNYFSDATFFYSHISYIIYTPQIIATMTCEGTTRGGPVFDLEGNFLGIGRDAASSNKTLYLPDNKSLNVTIADSWLADTFISAKHLPEMLASIPSKPEGDPYGNAGIVDSQVVKREVAKFLGLKDDESGIVVSQIVEKSAADKAGLKKGDIVVGLNGERFKTVKPENYLGWYLMTQLRRMKVGETAKIAVIRDSNPQIIDVNIVLEPSQKDFRQAEYKYFPRLGFSVREFIFSDAEDRKILKYDTQGAVVRWVKSNSPAASALPARVYGGDWIKEINSTPVKSYAEALKLLEDIEKDKAAKELVLVLEDDTETRVSRIKLD